MDASRQHVLFITGEYPPLAGGVGAYTQRVAEALTPFGWKASVLTTSQLSHHRFEGAIDVYPLVDKWSWQIWKTVPALAESIQANWLHVQYQTAAYAMNPSINFAVDKWQKAGYYVGWTYHDLLPPYLFPKAGRRLRTFVTNQPARQADVTVVTNEGDRLSLDSVAANLARIPIGSNILAPSLTAEDRKATRAQYGYTDDDLVLAYFGFLNRSKGGHTLVSTLNGVRSQLPDSKLLMIGERVGVSDPTNYTYLQEIESLIQRLELSDAVQWTGHLEDADVSLALNAVDILFMPYEDGASLRRGTLMAGLAHGCVVITTTPSAPIPELVDGQAVVYVAPGNAQGATDAILELANDIELRNRLQEGAKAASQYFTWEEIARQHVRLYKSLSD